MPVLTPEQIEELRRIIDDASMAAAVVTSGYEVSDEVLERLIDEGYIKPEQLENIVLDSYTFGQLMNRLPEAKDWLYRQFQAHMQANPLALTPTEQAAVKHASARAGEFIVGLGNRYSQELGITIVDADQALADRMRAGVRTAVAEKMAKRETVGELKSKLGHMSGDWARDWGRVAATESHNAHQEGVVAATVARHGDDALMAKIPEPGACFVSGARVLTRRGHIRISDVEIGDEVLTHKLRWRPVTRLFRREYQGPLYGVNGPPIATANHPYLVGMEWRRADSIKSGEQVVELGWSCDSEDDPTIIAKELLLEGIPCAGSSAVVPAASIQLYRDLQRRDSDIGVVGADGVLQDRTKAREFFVNLQSFWGRACSVALAGFRYLTAGLRGACQFARFASGGSNPSALYCGEMSHLDLLDFGQRSKRDIVLKEPLLDRSFGSPQFLGDLDQGCSFPVEADNQGVVQIQARHGHTATLFARKQKVNKPVSGMFGGEVFNLEVAEDHSYFVEGLAVHNCEHCLRLYLGDDKLPRVEPASWWQDQGTNVGLKPADWKPVLGAMHPWCLLPGQPVLTPRGPRPIESLAVGDPVLQGDGTWGRVTQLFRRQYVGKATELVLSDGGVVRATAGHYLLGGCGHWQLAELLQEGSELRSVGISDAEDSPAFVPKEALFARVFLGFSRGGMPVAAVYFDGEFARPITKIDEVAADQLIVQEAGDPRLFQERFDHDFQRGEGLPLPPDQAGGDPFIRIDLPAARFVGRGGIQLAFLGAHRFHADLHAFRLRSLAEPGLLEALDDGSTRYPELSGYLLYGELLLEVKARDVGRDSLACPPSRDVVILEALIDGGPRDAELFSDRVDRQPAVKVQPAQECLGDIAFPHASVLSSESFDYRGECFNLTVEPTNTYVSGGVVNKNCRCQLVRVPAGFGFNEEMELLPESMIEKAVDSPPADSLSKAAHKLHYRTTFQGFPISIENRKGSIRHWYDKATGTEGETKFEFPYGYIRLTEGMDGDHVDVFLGPDEQAQNAYVVHQMKAPHFKAFDEDKCMLGFPSAAAAKAAYLRHYDRPDFFGGMTTLPLEEFRKKVYARKRGMIKAQQLGLDFAAKPQTPPQVGPFIGPRGGKWKDAQHTIPWDDSGPKKRERKVKVPPPGVTTPAYLKALESSLIKIASRPASTHEEFQDNLRQARVYAQRMRDDLLYTRGMWQRVGPSRKEKSRLLKAAARVQEGLIAVDEVLSDTLSRSDFQKEHADKGRAGELDPWRQQHYAEWVGKHGGHTAWVKDVVGEMSADLLKELKAPLDSLMRAARILGKESTTVSPLTPFLRRFKIGDATVAFNDHPHRAQARMPRLPVQMNEEDRQKMQGPASSETVARAALKAKRALEAAGMGHLWHGVIEVGERDAKGRVFDVALGAYRDVNAAAFYYSGPDKVGVHMAWSSDSLAGTIVHEIGHRYWFKNLTSEDRARFTSQFGKVEATSAYGATNEQEDFAEAFAAFVIGRGRKDMTRDQVDRFKTYLGKAELTEDELEKARRLAQWTKAVEAAGIEPAAFKDIVRKARAGEPEFRAQLDAVYVELRKANAHEGFSRKEMAVIGTMGHHSKPARTAGENVRPSPQTQHPVADWPPNRDPKKRRKKRRKVVEGYTGADRVGETRDHLVDPKARFDVKGAGYEPGNRMSGDRALVQQYQHQERTADAEGSKEAIVRQTEDRISLRGPLVMDEPSKSGRSDR